MKIINVEQGSPEWLAWRKTVITATECPVIMGLSPWSTPYKCWQKKLGLIEDEKTNEAMERGKRLEPYIRDRFILKSGIKMLPTVVESSEYPFLGASLDGMSATGEYIMEVKTGGEKLYLMALEGKMPEEYRLQIQKQLLVTRAKLCYYVVGSEDPDKDVVIEVLPDPDFEAMYLPVAREIWRCIALCESPPLQKKDYRNMDEDSLWYAFSNEYRKACERIKVEEEIKQSYRKELIKLCNNQNCEGGGIEIRKTISKGRVAYDNIPELEGVDLDKYRKSPITSWTITLS